MNMEFSFICFRLSDCQQIGLNFPTEVQLWHLISKKSEVLEDYSIFHQSHPYGLPPKDVWSYRGKTNRLSANARTYLYGSLHEHVERDGNVHKIEQIPKYLKPTTDKPKNKSFSFFAF